MLKTALLENLGRQHSRRDQTETILLFKPVFLGSQIIIGATEKKTPCAFFGKRTIITDGHNRFQFVTYQGKFPDHT